MTYEQVAMKADELKNRHPGSKNPSVRQVYAETGGDYNTVQKHMKAWRNTQVSASPVGPTTLSPEFLRAMSDEITKQRAAATASQSAELDECREELEDLQREYGVQGGRKADLEAQLQTAASERERLSAECEHQAQQIEQLEQQAKAERAAAENARIELVKTQLTTSRDADLVVALRAEVDSRRSEIEAERAARIEADRRLAASDATCQALMARTKDLLARVEEVEAARDRLSQGLEMERNRRGDAERERDVVEQRALAAIACADDLRTREAALRSKIDGNWRAQA